MRMCLCLFTFMHLCILQTLLSKATYSAFRLYIFFISMTLLWQYNLIDLIMCYFLLPFKGLIPINRCNVCFLSHFYFLLNYFYFAWSALLFWYVGLYKTILLYVCTWPHSSHRYKIIPYVEEIGCLFVYSFWKCYFKSTRNV